MGCVSKKRGSGSGAAPRICTRLENSAGRLRVSLDLIPWGSPLSSQH